MAATGDDRELPRDASERRLEFAIEYLTSLFRQKHGNQKSFGESSVTLHWKGGEIELVTVQDGVTYK